MQSHKINNNHTRAQKQKKHACDKDIVSAVIITNSPVLVPSLFCNIWENNKILQLGPSIYLLGSAI